MVLDRDSNSFLKEFKRVISLEISLFRALEVLKFKLQTSIMGNKASELREEIQFNLTCHLFLIMVKDKSRCIMCLLTNLTIKRMLL